MYSQEFKCTIKLRRISIGPFLCITAVGTHLIGCTVYSGQSAHGKEVYWLWQWLEMTAEFLWHCLEMVAEFLQHRSDGHRISAAPVRDDCRVSVAPVRGGWRISVACGLKGACRISAAFSHKRGCRISAPPIYVGSRNALG